jgi:hypothetical protein
MRKIKHLIFCLILIFCSSCADSKKEIQANLLNSSNFDKSVIYAKKARELGIEGIPIFNNVISANIDRQYNVASYGKLMLCLNHLNQMAKYGISSDESIPVLFNLLENQISISDSLITAKTIEMISETNVGYDKNFAKTYTITDEPKRREMISKWKSLLIGNRGSN